jgi:hypothetical protein
MSLKTREKWWDFLVMIGAQECTVNVSLVAYINSARDNEWSGVPAFKRIGVSKLSWICVLWLEAFKSSGKRRFRVRASHKFRTMWRTPTLDEKNE